MKVLSKLSGHNLVRALPNINYDKDKICEACIKGKQTKSSFHSKNAITSQRVQELLHIDLFGTTKILSLHGKSYGFVVVDDFTKFMWVLMLPYKDKSFEAFKKFCKKVQKEKGLKNYLYKE